MGGPNEKGSILQAYIGENFKRDKNLFAYICLFSSGFYFGQSIDPLLGGIIFGPQAFITRNEKYDVHV